MLKATCVAQETDLLLATTRDDEAMDLGVGHAKQKTKN